MNQSSTVSVIIPNYNYGRFIAESIQSVLAQTYPIHEIIVVDDGSTDDSIEIIRQFGNKARLITQQNQGVGAARNIGVENSSGEFIAFLDADDIWLPTKIEEQLKIFTDKEVGLVSCGAREFNSQNGETIEILLPDKTEWSAESILLRRHSINVSGNSIVVRRQTFEKVGGFDNRKQMHPAEDWEFCYRAALAGKVASVSKVLVNYRNHGGNGHLKTPQMERALILAHEKTFTDALPELDLLRRKSLGKLHTILAGSYFQAGEYRQFIKHTLRALQANPSNITRYVSFPWRIIRRLTSPPVKVKNPRS